MTLILCARTPSAMIVVADRRLSANGTIVDEEATKLTVVVTRDARTVVAYTGLARLGAFSTEEWLIDILGSSGDTHVSIYGLLDALRSEAGPALRKAGAEHERLTVLLAGFVYDNSGAMASAWKITNWEHLPATSVPADFACITHDFDTERVISAGNVSAIDPVDLRGAENVTAGPALAIGVERKLQSVIRATSRRAQAGNTVGAQCNACIVWSDTSAPIEATYYSNYPTHTMYSVNTIFRASGMITKGASMIAATQMPYAAVPKVDRNHPCSCGSGAKYKKCHGVLRYPYMPMFVSCRSESPPFPPSGQEPTVVTRGAMGL